MKLLFVLVAFVALVAVIQAKVKLPPLDESFEHYKEKFHKTYQCEDLEKLRLRIFEDTLKLIKAHNKLYEEGKSTYYMGINQFTDMLDSEIPRGYLPPVDKKHHE